MSTLAKKIAPFRLPERIEIAGPFPPEYMKVLTPAALNFVARLEREFGDRRRSLLQKRWERQVEIFAGRMPDFLVGTKSIRDGYWKIAPIPKDLLDRRVEITGPADRKTIINGLNSEANVFMADFEDSTAPTWQNIVQGQINLSDAVDRTITFVGPQRKEYRLHDSTATLMVRPRGLHLEEKHVRVDGQAISASIFDFGIFFFHNARKLVERGTGPYVYLPKLENHYEAFLWDDVFLMAQDELGLPRGTVKATVLIETITAAFEMEEILYQLRDHTVGLNCGRWDYIFSVIKKFRHYPEFVMPDRARLSMMSHFLRSYSVLLIQTCHKRNAHAMGGMAAQIPIKSDPRANEEALAKVRADKEREVKDGHDGTWVAHPALVPVAKDVFDAHMPGPNQITRKREDVQVNAQDLLITPKGIITEDGMRLNINVSLQYLEAWLNGVGCVPINNLMEDAATAEISRAQLWQWIHHPNVRLFDGRKVTMELYKKLLAEELGKIEATIGSERFKHGQFHIARDLLNKLVGERNFLEFLTVLGYTFFE
ncbi:MAG TPA: malate synthase A [Bacteroidota bacterium]|jgi:malate synthase|nr:malate synthase A [Bacteroidota bacterium]